MVVHLSYVIVSSNWLGLSLSVMAALDQMLQVFTHVSVAIWIGYRQIRKMAVIVRNKQA